MGLFMDLAAVLAPAEQVKQYLAQARSDGSASCIEGATPDRALVIYEESTGKFDRIQRLSAALDCAVFALHIHDEDFWVYELYSKGELINRFNPMPDYWGDISDEEIAKWKGDPGKIEANWPGVTVSDIERYLVRRDIESASSAKAYPDDEFEAWDIWQICDFLKKLGTPYPEGEGE